MKWRHYKQAVLDNIVIDSDPNDRHIREWTEPWIRPKQLLRDMEREGLISIQYVNDRGCVRRYIQKLRDCAWKHE